MKTNTDFKSIYRWLEAKFSLRGKFIVAIGAIISVSYMIFLYRTSIVDNELIILQAKQQARMLYNQILITRQWVSEHNGIFVIRQDSVDSNPYLALPSIWDQSGNEYVNRDVLLKRSPVYMDECSNCEAIAICGNGCAYNAWVKNNNIYSIDEDACKYTKLFYKKFIEDLFKLIKPNLNKNSIYIPKLSDRKKMYGNIKINKLNLNSSIGHEL
jgi:radical SAM protein with 4Fe4S-binding SPASM domain